MLSGVRVRFWHYFPTRDHDCRRISQPLLDVLCAEYRSSEVVARKRVNANSANPLPEGRDLLNSEATAFVCQNFTCQMPATEGSALVAQLGGNKVIVCRFAWKQFYAVTKQNRPL